MSEWGVFEVIVGIVGLFLAVGAPMLTLNANIVKLNTRLQQAEKDNQEQKQELAAQREASKESHRRLWQHNTEQDATLNDHETRITILEKR